MDRNRTANNALTSSAFKFIPLQYGQQSVNISLSLFLKMLPKESGSVLGIALSQLK